MNRLFSLPPTLRLLRRLPLPKKLGFLERLYGAKLETHGIQWLTCSNGVIWKLNLADPCHRWIIYGVYEGGAGIKLAQKILKNGGVYVDSGANIGQWLLYISGQAGVTTLAFEPVSSQRQWLNQCLELQNDWQAEIIACGLGESMHSARIQTSGAQSSLRMDWYQAKNLATEEIKIRPLQDVLSQNNIDEVTFWKLDVEGNEFNALIGAKNYLEKHRIKHIYLECHPSNFCEVKALLENYGYTLFSLTRGKMKPQTDPEIDHTEDFLAMPC